MFTCVHSVFVTSSDPHFIIYIFILSNSSVQYCIVWQPFFFVVLFLFCCMSACKKRKKGFCFGRYTQINIFVWKIIMFVFDFWFPSLLLLLSLPYPQLSANHIISPLSSHVVICRHLPLLQVANINISKFNFPKKVEFVNTHQIHSTRGNDGQESLTGWFTVFVDENHWSPLVSVSVLSLLVQRATDQTSVPRNL